MDFVIHQKTQKIVHPTDYLKLIHLDKQVAVKRNSFKQIPDDVELMEMTKNSLELSNVLSSEVVEELSDKLIYYYFHFLINRDQKIKTHFYNGFIKLMTELIKMGYKMNSFGFIKEISSEKRKHTEQLMASLIEKIEADQSAYHYKEISRLYENARMEHTAYGEHIEPLLNTIIQRLPVAFY
ncbi:MAG: hypothetical protein PHV30_10370 [Candidatus Margulisbacteria bacterium]|nr:hypothetical protein [Candidatus Margulisiibacteriota bacterium]